MILTATQKRALISGFGEYNNLMSQRNDLYKRIEEIRTELTTIAEDIGIEDFDISATYEITPENELIRR